jgi:hypothetical protein
LANGRRLLLLLLLTITYLTALQYIFLTRASNLLNSDSFFCLAARSAIISFALSELGVTQMILS